MTGIEAKGSKARSRDGSSSVGHKALPTLVLRRGKRSEGIVGDERSEAPGKELGSRKGWARCGRK